MMPVRVPAVMAVPAVHTAGVPAVHTAGVRASSAHGWCA
eukprot:SAG25_NODE_11890_length_292_cov_1.331606_1_plen_38_part_10